MNKINNKNENSRDDDILELPKRHKNNYYYIGCLRNERNIEYDELRKSIKGFLHELWAFLRLSASIP